MCYYKSPYDEVYERGDSVALAVSSGNIPFPERDSPLKDLIATMLIVDSKQRPFITDVLQSIQTIKKAHNL